MDLLEEARSLEPEIIRIRRAIHQRPELSFQENATAGLVAEKLRSMGIEVRANVGGTGVLGVLRGSKRGKVVGLRADMDALPIEEMADVEFKSKAKGVMHACGHDTHVAMLLGAARLLARHRDELSGVVKFFFQPAEEHGGRGGAKPMIEDGVMRNPKVDYVFGLHIEGDRNSGEFGVRSGAVMAAPDAFEVRIHGKGGHGSAPHQTVDPIYIAAHLILALQGVSSRMIDPVQPFVISIGSVHGGTKENIIPDDAVLQGTVRTLDSKTRRRAIKKVKEVSKATCRTFGATCVVEFIKDAYPITYNDPKATARVTEILKTMRGTKVKVEDQMLGGEDFSRFLEKAPGTFYFLGTRNPRKGCVYPNHSSRFRVDEDVLKFGAASLAAVAFEFTNPSSK